MVASGEDYLSQSRIAAGLKVDIDVIPADGAT